MKVHLWFWTFFTLYTLTTGFAVLNLFIGIIVDAMQIVHKEERANVRAAEEAEFGEVLSELCLLCREMHELRGRKECAV